MIQQVSVQARVKRIIEADGCQFKDLNGNGVLDRYEDWRPAARFIQRLAELVQAGAGLAV